jgi:hypothetical protein
MEFGKASMLGQRSGIASAMQDAHDDQLTVIVTIIDDKVSGEGRPQAGRKVLPRNAGMGQVAEWRGRLFDLGNQPRCRLL